MSQFLLAPAAKSDIFEIGVPTPLRLAIRELADRMRDEIFNGIRAAARNQVSANLRRDRLADEPLRSSGEMRKYLISQETNPDGAGVDGARDVQAVLGEG